MGGLNWPEMYIATTHAGLALDVLFLINRFGNEYSSSETKLKSGLLLEHCQNRVISRTT